jgi:PTH1 family peptidyl-tRNA hydrolase
MKLIVGLGNPGVEYAGTRHNAGFAVIDLLARRHNISVIKRDFQAVFGDGYITGQRVILARPMTYMNLSGDAVAAIARFFKLEPSDIIIILDDIALPVGRVRLRMKGSAGGQNGLANILQRLGTQEVPRIRLGVGAARPGEMVGHVLSRFPKEDLPLMEEAYVRAAEAVECAVQDSFENAMNRYNVSDKPPKDEPRKQTPDEPSPRAGATD